MKFLLLWLLPLLLKLSAAGPALVRVTFSPLTQAACLAVAPATRILILN